MGNVVLLPTGRPAGRLGLGTAGAVDTDSAVVWRSHCGLERSPPGADSATGSFRTALRARVEVSGRSRLAGAVGGGGASARTPDPLGAVHRLVPPSAAKYQVSSSGSRWAGRGVSQFYRLRGGFDLGHNPVAAAGTPRGVQVEPVLKPGRQSQVKQILRPVETGQDVADEGVVRMMDVRAQAA